MVIWQIIDYKSWPTLHFLEKMIISQIENRCSVENIGNWILFKAYNLHIFAWSYSKAVKI